MKATRISITFNFDSSYVFSLTNLFILNIQSFVHVMENYWKITCQSNVTTNILELKILNLGFRMPHA